MQIECKKIVLGPLHFTIDHKVSPMEPSKNYIQLWNNKVFFTNFVNTEYTNCFLGMHISVHKNMFDLNYYKW